MWPADWQSFSSCFTADGPSETISGILCPLGFLSSTDRDLLEKVQQRITNMIKGLKDLPCEGRLRNWGLFTLGISLRGDLINVYNNLKSTSPVDAVDEENLYFEGDRVLKHASQSKLVVLSPSLEILKTHLEAFLCN